MGIGPLKARLGPDQVVPIKSLVGLSGLESTAPTGVGEYKWSLHQVPSGAPGLYHFPVVPNEVLYVEPDFVRVEGFMYGSAIPTYALQLTASSNEIELYESNQYHVGGNSKADMVAGSDIVEFSEKFLRVSGPFPWPDKFLQMTASSNEVKVGEANIKLQGWSLGPYIYMGTEAGSDVVSFFYAWGGAPAPLPDEWWSPIGPGDSLDIQFGADAGIHSIISGPFGPDMNKLQLSAPLTEDNYDYLWQIFSVSPIDLTAYGVVTGDTLTITSGSNAGSYTLTTDPYGPSLDTFQIDSALGSSGVTLNWQIGGWQPEDLAPYGILPGQMFWVFDGPNAGVYEILTGPHGPNNNLIQVDTLLALTASTLSFKICDLAPFSLAGFGVTTGDQLKVLQGPNAGTYTVTSAPYGPSLSKVTIDSDLSATEFTAHFEIWDEYSRTVKATVPLDWVPTIPGAALFMEGVTTAITYAYWPYDSFGVEDYLLAGKSYSWGTAAVWKNLYFFDLGDGRAYFVPPVQGLFVFGLRVSASPTWSEFAFESISVVAAGVRTGVPVDASWIWRSLSDFWERVSDKGWMETTWKAVIRVFGAMLQEAWTVRAHASLAPAQDVAMSRWVPIDIAVEEPNSYGITVSPRFKTLIGSDSGYISIFPGFSFYIYIWDKSGSRPDPLSDPFGAVDATYLLFQAPVPGDHPDELITAFLASHGYKPEDIKVWVQDIGGRKHLAVHSSKYQIVAIWDGFGYGGGINTIESRWMLGVPPQAAWRKDDHTLVLSPPGTDWTQADWNNGYLIYDVLGIIKPGDMINVAGIPLTVERTGYLTSTGAYPNTRATYIVTKEELPPATPGSDQVPWLVPHQIVSTEVDYGAEKVWPGDQIIIERSNGETTETKAVVVASSGSYRLGVHPVEGRGFFLPGWTVRVLRVVRSRYIPIDETYLSAPVLVPHAESKKGYEELLHYAITEVYGQHVLMFEPERPSDYRYNDAVEDYRNRYYNEPLYHPQDRLWAELMYIDRRPDLSLEYGERLGMPLYKAPSPPGFSYARALLGLWYCYLHGSKPGFIERGLSIVAGAPFFEEEGTVIGTFTAGTQGVLLVRDDKNTEVVRTYIYPLSAGLDTNPDTGEDYKIGDIVHQFNPVTQAVFYRDWISHPEIIKALVASGVISEPEKLHRFWVAVDTDVIDAGNLEAIANAYQFLLDFKTTYNYPFFVLLKKFIEDIAIEDEIEFKVTLQLETYFGARWGYPRFDRIQLSGLDNFGTTPEFAPPPPNNNYTNKPWTWDTPRHNYFDIFFVQMEHFGLHGTYGGMSPSVYWLNHATKDGLSDGSIPEQWRVNPQQYGIQIDDELYAFGGLAFQEFTITAVFTDSFEAGPGDRVPQYGKEFWVIWGPAGARRTWWGFDQCKFYLRDHVRLLMRKVYYYLHLVASSDIVTVTDLLGAPVDLTVPGVASGDVLWIEAGPYANVYSIISNPFGPGNSQVQIDTTMPATEDYITQWRMELPGLPPIVRIDGADDPIVNRVEPAHKRVQGRLRAMTQYQLDAVLGDDKVTLLDPASNPLDPATYNIGTGDIVEFVYGPNAGRYSVLSTVPGVPIKIQLDQLMAGTETTDKFVIWDEATPGGYPGPEVTDEVP